jgi:hypothetical protein
MYSLIFPSYTYETDNSFTFSFVMSDSTSEMVEYINLIR